MPELTLVAETGRALGSGASRRLRQQDKIPVVLYGHGSEPQHLAVHRPSLRAALNSAGPNAVITLQIDGDEQLAIVKEMQRDTIANRVTHVDFQLIRLDERLVVDVPVTLVGEAVLAEREGAIVQQQLMTISIEAPAGSIPGNVEVDITDLTIATPIRISDLVAMPDVTLLDDEDALVAVAQRSRASLAEETEEVEGEELEEGEEGVEAEGEAGEDASDDGGD